MTIHLLSREEFAAPSARILDRGLAESSTTLSPLEEELALMDCAIPMTRIPTHLLDDVEDHDLQGMNLFGPVMEDESDAEAENFLRESTVSPLAHSRVVALRRRRIRAKLRRPQPAWPLPGGQAEGELRSMRERIYTVEADEVEEKPSVPLRVATHAIGLSLVATALPVGAAVMTYNLLKGEDMRVTARLTTLTGLALAVIAGNPHLAQLIGV